MVIIYCFFLKYISAENLGSRLSLYIYVAGYISLSEITFVPHLTKSIIEEYSMLK